MQTLQERRRPEPQPRCGLKAMSVRAEPARQAGHIARQLSSWFAGFVADNAADGCTADGSDRAATRKNGASDGTDSGADGGVLILPRHAGTTTQAEQHCCGNCTDRNSLYRFHGNTSVLETGYRNLPA